MAQKIIMPKQGLQMTEGTVTRWLKSEGETVQAGEPLFEIETDKLAITIDATATGTLLKILHDAGDVVPVAEAIAFVGEPGEDFSSAMGDAERLVPAETHGFSPVPLTSPSAVPDLARENGRILITPRAKMRAEERSVDYTRLAGSGPEGLIIERDIASAAAPVVTPLAKKVAQSEGVELMGLSGSGARGKITARDVRSAASGGPARTEKRIPLTGMRKIIAQRMKQSLSELAQANHRMKVDMSEAVRLREQLKKTGVSVSYNDIVLRCTAKALTEFPMMNASIEGEEIVQKEYVNLGVAVATDAGLLVPVLKDTDLMTLPEIAEASSLAAQRTKEGKLSPDELTGGTFTVSNLGMFDVDSFTAIINAPEAGILAVGKLSKQPVVIDDAVCVRPMMELSLTYDHRIVDGAPAARFLQRIKALLEQPYLLL